MERSSWDWTDHKGKGILWLESRATLQEIERAEQSVATFRVSGDGDPAVLVAVYSAALGQLVNKRLAAK